MVFDFGSSKKRRLDDNTIEVLAGDIPKGFWNFDGLCMRLEDEQKRYGLDLDKNVKNIDVRLRKKIANLDALVDFPVGGIMSMVGAKFLGPVGGMLAGAVSSAAGSTETICVGCELHDGRKFIAVMKGKTLERFQKLKPSSWW